MTNPPGLSQNQGAPSRSRSATSSSSIPLVESGRTRPTIRPWDLPRTSLGSKLTAWPKLTPIPKLTPWPLPQTGCPFTVKERDLLEFYARASVVRPPSSHSTLNTQHSALNTQHPTPNTQHSALNIQHSAPNTQHSTLNTQHSTLNSCRGSPPATYGVTSGPP